MAKSGDVRSDADRRRVADLVVRGVPPYDDTLTPDREAELGARRWLDRHPAPPTPPAPADAPPGGGS